MSTNISVNKKSIEAFLYEGKKRTFLIPDYQRPYSWGKDEVNTLFEDIKNYTKDNLEIENKPEYFLGCVVLCENNSDNIKQQEIIDGQQRITTIFLLLRALYEKLKSDSTTKESSNFLNKIESIIWKTNELTGEADKNSILLKSQAIDDSSNEVLFSILKHGKAESKNKDKYSTNYIEIQKLIDKLILDNAGDFVYHFINNILRYSILLPIEADGQNTALQIFSTLNNRGLPLEDADIFKAAIYNKLPKDEKDNFITRYKNLSNLADEAQQSIQSLFYYCMFFILAKENKIDTTTPGVRKFFMEDYSKYLFDEKLMDFLEEIANFLMVVNTANKTDESWSESNKILSILDVIKTYPNEFWKYPTIIYYLTYKNDIDFEKKFYIFLRQLSINLLHKYLRFPYIGAVKSNILKLNAEIIKKEPHINFTDNSSKIEDEQIIYAKDSIAKMILKLLAYENPEQIELLSKNCELEHILPKKYDNMLFEDEDPEYIDETIQNIGNKTILEKKINIKASNNFFSNKRIKYNDSIVLDSKDIAKKNKTWGLDKIKKRNKQIIQRLNNLFLEIQS